MSESVMAPVSFKDRIEILDVLRGFAVCGIFIGNMQWFSGYGMMPPALAEQGPYIDRITHFLVHFFVEGKFYSIFSFLFGIGFAMQIARAAERGDDKASLFKRRLFWLLVIGLLHAYLLWAGDILSIYAVMGFLLLLFRNKPDSSLLKWALILILIPILFGMLQWALFAAFATPEMIASIETAKAGGWDNAVKKVLESTYIQIVTDFNLNYIVGRYMGLILQMRLPKILAMFLLGFYAYRKGYFQNLSDHKPFIRKVLTYGLILGLIGNAAFALSAASEADFPPSPASMVGIITYAFGVPSLALFYVALIATLWQKQTWQRILGVLAPVGRMAMTNYLLQTVVCFFFFYGVGFGQFGKYRATAATGLVFGIFAVQIVLSTLWLKYFNYGPMEWIWRQLTYRKRLSLRISTSSAADA